MRLFPFVSFFSPETTPCWCALFNQLYWIFTCRWSQARWLRGLMFYCEIYSGLQEGHMDRHRNHRLEGTNSALLSAAPPSLFHFPFYTHSNSLCLTSAAGWSHPDPGETGRARGGKTYYQWKLWKQIWQHNKLKKSGKWSYLCFLKTARSRCAHTKKYLVYHTHRW